MNFHQLFSRCAWVLALAVFLLAACVLPLRAANIEPPILPSVYATLSPTSAIQVPLRLAGDQCSVWSVDAEQRMLLSGHVAISIGYRLLRAHDAAVWLTPSREAGESTWDVAIYLSGDVEVREGNADNATRTMGKELLVTTRVTQQVQLLTSKPEPKNEQDSPLVKRGDEIRTELLTHRAPPWHIPTIVITPAELALQSGWIARDHNNRIIPGPGDIQTVRDAAGNIIHIPSLPAGTQPAKPRPTTFLTGDHIHVQQIGKELAYIVPNPYLLYDFQDGKPPLEFRAQQLVAFGPAPESTSATAPATATGPASQASPGGAPVEKALSQQITGVYLEGNVSLDQGDQIMIRAERIYYDLTTHRAIMLDATLASVDTTRDVPIYLRASEIRQLSRSEFAAKNVKFSTSEFYTPHYHIGASEIYLRDVSPELEAPNAGAAPGTTLDLGLGSGSLASKDFQFQVKDASIDINGNSVFYWPFLSGDTSGNDIPLKTIRVSNSRTYGITFQTDWDVFALTGQTPPEGVRTDLSLDYFGKRGPATGLQSQWNTDEDTGILHSYVILDQGVDRLGRDRDSVIPPDQTRGRLGAREMHDLGNGWSLSLEGSYISDPTFLEQFFEKEFDTDKENETSIYLKNQTDNAMLSFLGKWNLMDFTASASREDDQFSTDKQPEIKYWRIGDNLLDMFTYYSESGVADLHTDITNFTPKQLGLQQSFLGLPASVVPLDKTYRAYLQAHGWDTGDVLRGDTRQEIDLPLQLGDLKLSPYATARFTYWDAGFPDQAGGNNGSTTRVWGGGGIRSSMQFWKVYDDAESIFLDVHRLRHIIEPQFNVFVGASNVDRKDLQPFDRDVEQITGASGTQLAINQKWETKRGGEGHWRDVDWIVVNFAWNQFYNKDKTGTFLPQDPLRGFYFPSRPDLSLATSSLTLDWVWRAGERVRFLGDANYNLDTHNLEQASFGLAIDQNKQLSYFLGNRYIHALNTDEWTFGLDYQLTLKYELIAAESYDFKAGSNILTSMTLLRKLPRFNAAVTVTYDANDADTSVMFTAWPEGFPSTLSPATGYSSNH